MIARRGARPPAAGRRGRFGERERGCRSPAPPAWPASCGSRSRSPATSATASAHCLIACAGPDRARARARPALRADARRRAARSSAACSPASRRATRASRSRRATGRRSSTSRSAATGTTRSRCRATGSGSWSATSSAAAWARRARWAAAQRGARARGRRPPAGRGARPPRHVRRAGRARALRHARLRRGPPGPRGGDDGLGRAHAARAVRRRRAAAALHGRPLHAAGHAARRRRAARGDVLPHAGRGLPPLHRRPGRAPHGGDRRRLRPLLAAIAAMPDPAPADLAGALPDTLVEHGAPGDDVCLLGFRFSGRG